MAVTREQALQAFLAGTQGTNPFVEGDQARKTKKLEAYLAPITKGKEQAAVNAENLKTLQSPELQDLVNQGGMVKAGDLSYGAKPIDRAAMMGPKQASGFLKTAQGAYKPINDQLDAAKATLDALNQGNANSDKVALINEARIAAGQGGSRAIAHLVDLMSGGQTSASDFQGKINWLQNTPNIPEMQPAQRDAIRESVFGRLPQLSSQHKQAAAQLMQQGPVIAPTSDYNTIISSFTTPTQQKLDELGKMNEDYRSARAKMGGGAISKPAVANDNPTTLDKLRSLFGGGNKTAAPAAPQGGFDPDSYLGGK